MRNKKSVGWYKAFGISITILCFVMPLAAASNNWMQVEDSSAIVGTTSHIIIVKGEWNEPLGAYQMVMRFEDYTAIEFKKVIFSGTIGENADLFRDWDKVQPGVINAIAIWGMNSLPPAGNGILFKVKVDILGPSGDFFVELLGDIGSGCRSAFYRAGGSIMTTDLIDGTLTIYEQECGDVNADGIINVADVVYLLNYLFRNGPEPATNVCFGDCNTDGIVNVADGVHLLNYLFKSGEKPGNLCCN